MTQEREAAARTRRRTQRPGTAGRQRQERTGVAGFLLGSSVGRNLGLVVALSCSASSASPRRASSSRSIDNALTILRLASVIGVVSIGMTFVITGGGIDLSVGAIVALSSVWSTTLATQSLARGNHWTADGPGRAASWAWAAGWSTAS